MFGREASLRAFSFASIYFLGYAKFILLHLYQPFIRLR